MQTQNISFCDRIGLNIKSNEVKQNILDDLEEIKIIEKHHENFDKEKHDKRLRKVPHLLSIRSNGNPYYMFFTRINFTNTIVMIDKKIQMGYVYPRMIITRLMFHDETLFDNTLLEGEMIKDKNSEWLYLISDLLVYKGKSMKEHDLFKRLDTIRDILESSFVESCHDIFRVQIKKYVPLNQAKGFHNAFIQSLNYTCRGLYFKPIYTKFRDILFNFDSKKIVQNNKKPKFKSQYHFVTNETINIGHQVEKESASSISIKTNISPSDENKQTFLIQKTDTPDVYKLFEIDSKNYVENACIDTLKTSKMLTKHFQNKTMLEKLSFECIQNRNVHLSTRWIPIKLIETQ